MSLISPLFQERKKETILSDVDCYISNVSKKRLQNFLYGFECKIDRKKYEYLTILRDMYIEKMYNNPCLCNITSEILKNRIYKIIN